MVVDEVLEIYTAQPAGTSSVTRKGACHLPHGGRLTKKADKLLDKSKFEMQNLTIGRYIVESRPDPDASHRPTGSTPPRPCHSE